MSLSHNAQKQILKKFPHLELSYERKLHKKVQADIYLTIPKGKKYFAWFTNWNNKNMCFLLEINKKYNSIANISVNICSFDKMLCCGKGTVLYGTIFFVNKNKFFNIENIYYFKGRDLINYTQLKKFKEINNLMKYYLRQTSHFKNTVTFGLPIMDTNIYNLKKNINELPYSLYCIQYRLLHRDKPFLNEFIKLNRCVYKIFLIKPTIINDIYELYFKNNSTIEKYKTACIPDYKTSVMMNSLFRTIKENENLDFLEESDDEEEFENILPDKFVDLNKEIKMKCVFMENFDSWKPIEISNENISPRREIICYKKK